MRRLRLLNLAVAHRKARVPLLEAVAFDDPRRVMEDICSLEGVDGCVVVQTCHRTEVYTAVSDISAEADIIEYWLRRVKVDEGEFRGVLERAYDDEALNHLLRLASGLESMIVGEDQILGQIGDAYAEAEKAGTTGPILATAFRKAVKVGRLVRLQTRIDKGAVSVGSAAVDLSENVLGSLDGKRILIVGAGETGTLVGKALAEKGVSAVFVANRTYERGVRLAQMLGGKAVHFDELNSLLPEVDLAIVATTAPHYILTRERLEKSVKGDGKLIIVDLSQPRNVEESVGLIPNVSLFNIDNLRRIAEDNLKKRLGEVDKAERIIADELEGLKRMLRRSSAESAIAAICARIEETRQAELRKALDLLGDVDEKQRGVIEDLTRVLIRRTLHFPLVNLRKAAEDGDAELISAAKRLFDTKP